MDTPVTYARLPESFVPTEECLEALNTQGVDYQISKLRNISEGGLMISTTSYIEPGSHILMRFTLPNGKDRNEVVAIGEIKHLNLPDRPDIDTTIGMGIQFRHLSTRGTQAIHELVSRHVNN